MFCNKCGAQLPDDSAFCTSCGAQFGAQQAQPQTQTPRQGSKKLHCPQCKSHNIAITTESSVDGAISTSHGGFGRVSATKVSNTHRNFWVCSDCGTKFRNIQNLEEEIAKTKKLPTVCAVFSAILFIIALKFIIDIIGGNVFTIIIAGPFTAGLLVGAIVCFCFIFSYKKKLVKMKEELEYLKQNCF